MLEFRDMFLGRGGQILRWTQVLRAPDFLGHLLLVSCQTCQFDRCGLCMSLCPCVSLSLAFPLSVRWPERSIRRSRGGTAGVVVTDFPRLFRQAGGAWAHHSGSRPAPRSHWWWPLADSILSPIYPQNPNFVMKGARPLLSCAPTHPNLKCCSRAGSLQAASECLLTHTDISVGPLWQSRGGLGRGMACRGWGGTIGGIPLAF